MGSLSLAHIEPLDYDVDHSTGFIPSTLPLRAFPAYFRPWDDLAADLPKLITSHTLRGKIGALALLDATRLSTKEELRRAFVVLGFLVHGYVWCEGPEYVTTEIPMQLAEPYLYVCERLGVQGRETLSYAGLCVWNWGMKDGRAFEGVPQLEDMESLVTFTGTRDEEVFYLVPVLVELEGGRLPSLLLKATEDALGGDAGDLLGALNEATGSLKRMQSQMSQLHEQCNASLFWRQIRPFLAGGKDSGGWTYMLRDGTVGRRQCIGGSAAQSSTVPAIDALLGVRHKSMGDDPSVFAEMREYMPGPHRAFLAELEKLPSLGDFVRGQGMDAECIEAYNSTLSELAMWRSRHIGVVTTHIVNQARKASKDHVAAEEIKDGLSVKDESELQGTGGTALIPFLKGARQDTDRARC